MISNNDLERIQAGLQQAVKVLLELEGTDDDKQDRRFIVDLEYQINQIYGMIYAYSAGYRQE